ncbi:hypothetical protein [Methyloprofundus sp.]|uniref:hypothetical protein n=1 Tax=Methyloprofundus sp. TaxID=2020875 RepID=UPI003D130D16
MKDLNTWHSKLLKLLLASCLITLANLGYANETSENQLLTEGINSESLATLVNNLSENTLYVEMDTGLPPVNHRTPRNIQDFKELAGTWLLSYTYDDTRHTDKIEINDTTTTSDGTVLPIGKYFPDQAGNGFDLICGDVITESDTIVYLCFSNIAQDLFSGIFIVLHENSVTTGFFGLGETIEKTREDIFTQSHPLTGLRISDTMSASYNDENGELFIPKVGYKGDFYRATLKDQGNFVFKLQNASPAN